MIFKLALRNIRRNLRDYAIYFVTLVFGVAIFFAFNSITSQKVLFDLLDNAVGNIFELTEYMMGLFSMVVTCVLGFLVIYANRFLIRRRKREFGIYLTLGMSPGSVTRIVLMETIVVGVGALVLGLGLGIGLAQGLAFVTAALFGTTMTHYEFIFSTQSLLWTLISFAIIFIIVALFNTFTVSRLKLIDLLYGAHRNERTPVRNPFLCAIGFVIAIGLLAWAYKTLASNGLVEINNEFWLSTVLMLVGTLLLFWSLAGFVIGVLTRVRGIYLRGLVPFTTRQVASKINTAFLSLWAVAVMLFFSLTVFCTGMGLVVLFTGDIEAANPYDVTLRTDYYPVREVGESNIGERRSFMEESTPAMYAQAAAYDFDPLRLLQDRVEGWDGMVRSAAAVSFWAPTGMSFYEFPSFFETAGYPLSESDVALIEGSSATFAVMSVSDFNKLRMMLGQPTVKLDAGHYAINNNTTFTQSIAETMIAANLPLTIEGFILDPVVTIEKDQVCDMAMLSSTLNFIVPDEVVTAIKARGDIPLYTYTDIMLKDSTAAGEETFKRALYEGLKDPTWPAYEDTLGAGQVTNGSGYDNGALRSFWPISDEIFGSFMKSQAGGLRMLITYLALYIGFVLLIATAAILAIQQLSEVADSQSRYELLGALGCDRRMLGRSIFFQVLIYFLAPLVVACCHSAMATAVISDSLFNSFGLTVGTPILLTSLLVIGVYGVYLLITYGLSRMLVFRQWSQEFV